MLVSFSKCLLIPQPVATGKKLNSVQSLEIALTLHDTNRNRVYRRSNRISCLSGAGRVKGGRIVFSAGRQVRSGEELIIKATRLRGSIEVAH